MEQQSATDTWKPDEDDSKPKESVAQQTAAQAAATAAAAMADFAKKKKKKGVPVPIQGAGITAMKIKVTQELGKWKGMQVGVC